MRKSLLYLFVILFFCTACPYESTIPIGNPQVLVNKDLIGVWKNEVEREAPDNYDIRKATDFTYLITENMYKKDDRSLQQKRYHAFVSVLEGKTYLNVKMIKDSINITVSDNYFLYKIELQERKLKLMPLSQYIREQFKQATDLQDFIGKYQDLSFFYGEHSDFIKVND
jgi:hypothetical protein